MGDTNSIETADNQPTNRGKRAMPRGRPFLPGQSGNPNGRPPKGQTLTDLMHEYLLGKEEGQEKTRKEQFVERVARLAYNGDLTAIRMIWNYIDGMPVQKTEVDGTIRNRDLEDLTDEELQELFYERINKIIKK